MFWSRSDAPARSTFLFGPGSFAGFTSSTGFRNLTILILSGVSTYWPRSPSTTTGLRSILPLKIWPPSISTWADR